MWRIENIDCVGTISFIQHIAVLSSNLGGDELVLKVEFEIEFEIGVSGKRTTSS